MNFHLVDQDGNTFPLLLLPGCPCFLNCDTFVGFHGVLIIKVFCLQLIYDLLALLVKNCSFLVAFSHRPDLLVVSLYEVFCILTHLLKVSVTASQIVD